MMTERKPWAFAAGRGPHRVRVYEHPERDWTLYLMWKQAAAGGLRSRRVQSLGRQLRTTDGKIVREVERWAKAEAQAKHEALIRGVTDPAEAALPRAPLTIGEAKAIITDPKTGRYPTKTQHRAETERSLDYACAVWGSSRAWNTIRKSDLRALGRARIDDMRKRGHDGLRAAELTVQRVVTVANTLRDEETPDGEPLIDETACVAPKNWKQELRSYWLEVTGRHDLPKSNEANYTLDEARRIWDLAAATDPRLDLLLWIAPNQRGGQTVRAHRSNLNLDRNVLTIPGRGAKLGAVISLSPGERAAVDIALQHGYLRLLESAFLAGAIRDYPLFPAGQLPGGRAHRTGKPSDRAKPPSWRAPDQPTATVLRHANAKHLDRNTVARWFLEIETKAGVTHMPGRGLYGVRRLYTNLAKDEKLGRDALTALGGWADPQMADRIYAKDDQQVAREEARDFRAKIRRPAGAEPEQ